MTPPSPLEAAAAYDARIRVQQGLGPMADKEDRLIEWPFDPMDLSGSMMSHLQDQPDEMVLRLETRYGVFGFRISRDGARLLLAQIEARLALADKAFDEDGS